MRTLLFLTLLIPAFARADDCNEANLHATSIHYCIEENIPFDIALGCGEADLNSTSELTCLMHWTPADIAKECGDAVISPANETICILKRTIERREVLGRD